MPQPADADVAAVSERLRAAGYDVVRVSYADMIGVDRGRDVLLEELPAAAGHGLAFCRAVYHTSPMGDVVPVQGGLEVGLPDITVVPRPDHGDRAAVGAARGLVPRRRGHPGRRGRAGVPPGGGPAGGPARGQPRVHPGLRA